MTPTNECRPGADGELLAFEGNVSSPNRRGIRLDWEPGFEISTRIDGDEMVISANREGMVSLARHLMALADGVPGDHVHLDEHNSLEDGSRDLIIELVDYALGRKGLPQTS